MKFKALDKLVKSKPLQAQMSWAVARGGAQALSTLAMILAFQDFTERLAKKEQQSREILKEPISPVKKILIRTKAAFPYALFAGALVGGLKGYTEKKLEHVFGKALEKGVWKTL